MSRAGRLEGKGQLFYLFIPEQIKAAQNREQGGEYRVETHVRMYGCMYGVPVSRESPRPCTLKHERK